MVSSIGSGIRGIQQQDFLQQIQQEQQVQAKRIQAFSDSDSLSIGQGPSAKFQSAISPEMQGSINEMLSGLNEEDKQSVLASGKNLAKTLTSVSAGASAEDIGAMIYGDMANIANTLGNGDANMVACNSMLAAYAGVTDDLYGLANKCSNTTNLKKSIREDEAMLRDELANWPEGVDKIEITYNEYSQDANGNFIKTEVTKEMSKSEVQNLMSELDGVKETLTEMNQMDMLNLENAMNSQAQLLQTVSNIMKMMHDTAKSIIQNLR